MDVLNTYGGGVDGAAIFLAVLFALIATCCFVVAVLFLGDGDADGILPLFISLAFIAGAIGMYVNRYEPVRQEVVLREGYVIDAQKYEIIEQRGQTFVIEERKQPE